MQFPLLPATMSTSILSLPTEIRLQILEVTSHISPTAVLSLSQVTKSYYDLYLTHRDRLIRASIINGSNVSDPQLLYCLVTLAIIVEGHKLVTGYTVSSSDPGEEIREITRFCAKDSCPGLEHERAKRDPCAHGFTHESPSVYELAKLFPLKALRAPFYSPKAWEEFNYSVVDRYVRVLSYYEDERTTIVVDDNQDGYKSLWVTDEEVSETVEQVVREAPLAVLMKMYAVHTRCLICSRRFRQLNMKRYLIWEHFREMMMRYIGIEDHKIKALEGEKPNQRSQLQTLRPNVSVMASRFLFFYIYT